jgi:hypothetical protein
MSQKGKQEEDEKCDCGAQRGTEAPERLFGGDGLKG